MIFDNSFLAVLTCVDGKLVEVNTITDKAVFDYNADVNEDNIYTGLYVRAFGEYYPVAHIAGTVEGANLVMSEHEDAALIATENFHGKNRYWLAAKKPVNVSDLL